MSVAVAKANLADALKQLRQRWSKVRTQWDDDAARRFQREVIDPLEPAIAAACKALDHVGDLAHAAQRDCGNDE